MARYAAEGEAAFQPRSRAPKTTPAATAPQTVELVLRLRKQLDESGLDAGADTIGWHLHHHHDTTLSRATINRILTRAGQVTRTVEATQELLHPVRSRATQPDMAVRFHPLPTHPPRRPPWHRRRDPDLARRPLPVRPVDHRAPAGHRTGRAGHLPRNRCHIRNSRLHVDRQRDGLHRPLRRRPRRQNPPRGRTAPTQHHPEELPTQPPHHPAAKSKGSSKPSRNGFAPTTSSHKRSPSYRHC
jgi:hypothetical protein